MSTTFQIDGIDEERGHDLPCQACGHSLQSAIGLQFDCAACDGYGGPAELPTPRFELNVAEERAGRLLRFLGADQDQDQLDPRDVLCRLVAGPDALARAVQVDDETARRYIDTLTRIATKAIQYSRPITHY